MVCTRETGNPHDNYPVSIMRNLYVVGHVPLGLSKPFSNFLLLPRSTILCTVTGRKINRWVGLGLEIPQARGHEKAISGWKILSTRHFCKLITSLVNLNANDF